jgi:hypothetical protein
MNVTDYIYLVDVLKNTVVPRTSSKLLAKLQAIDPLITSIHFEYGHYTDIRQRLSERAKNNENRYPLICLFEDYINSHDKDGISGLNKPKIIILYLSKPDVTREAREINVFRPILYPIYFELLRQLKLCGEFNIYDETQIKHDEIKRPHWGNPALYKNDGYLFTDVLDGIELANLQLETYLQTC